METLIWKSCPVEWPRALQSATVLTIPWQLQEWKGVTTMNLHIAVFLISGYTGALDS